MMKKPFCLESVKRHPPVIALSLFATQYETPIAAPEAVIV